MTAQKDQDAPRRPGRPRGKKPGTANREQLMDIALTLFARDGAGRVSLNAIAKEAGVDAGDAALLLQLAGCAGNSAD